MRAERFSSLALHHPEKKKSTCKKDNSPNNPSFRFEELGWLAKQDKQGKFPEINRKKKRTNGHVEGKGAFC